MKTLFFALTTLLLFSVNAKAITNLAINNNIPCPVRVDIRYLDGSCLDIGGTSVSLGGSSSTGITVPSSNSELEITVVVNPGGASSTLGVVGCSRLCGSWPTSAFKNTPCSPTNAVTNGGGSSYTLNITL